VLALRFLDRVGKGLRSAPRDAMIASAAPGQRGRAFGFHRSMDHAGAVIGPLLAFGLLAADADLKHVFMASAVPGLLVVLLLVLGLPSAAPAAMAAPARFSWKGLHGRLRAMIVAAGLLALSSVPEVFVVLWARQAGLEVVWVPLVWAAASVAKMLIALPAGILSDRIGRIPLLLGGWTLRVAVLLLLAWSTPGLAGVWALFMAYSATLAITEPAERSVIGDHAAATERGTAFGLYHLASGLLVLPGAVIFGLIWQRFGSASAFAVSAAVTAAAALLMISLAGVRGSGSRRVP
jgi:MFS family permease